MMLFKLRKKSVEKNIIGISLKWEFLIKRDRIASLEYNSGMYSFLWDSEGLKNVFGVKFVISDCFKVGTKGIDLWNNVQLKIPRKREMVVFLLNLALDVKGINSKVY